MSISYNYRQNEKSPYFDTVRLAAYLASFASKGYTNDFAHAAMDLARISRSMRRINERACNGYRYESDELRDERTETRLRIRAQGIAAEFGLTCYFQTDPRGCALYIGHGLTSANYSSQGVAC